VLGHLGGARSERESRNTLWLQTPKSREWEVGLNATLLPTKTRAALCHRRAFGAAAEPNLLLVLRTSRQGEGTMLVQPPVDPASCSEVRLSQSVKTNDGM
jgi:hypothetical protein